MEQMQFVFISHSNKSPDAEFCERLYGYLSKKGIRCWMDREDMHFGDWKAQIIDKLLDAKVFVLVESKNSLISEQVQIEIQKFKEFNEIQKINRPIIPFDMDDWHKSADKDFIRKMKSASHNIGDNIQKVILSNCESEEEAFDKLVNYLLQLGFAQMKNNSADFQTGEDNQENLKKYTGHDSFVDIPAWIREIGENAFIGNKELVSVNIPETVKKINKRAFFGCRALSQVTGMNGVKDADYTAFKNTGVIPAGGAGFALNGILFGEEVGEDGKLPTATVIARNAFFGCAAKELKFEEGLEIVCNGAFMNSYKLQRVVFPSSLKVIGESAFSSCSQLREVIFKGAVPANAKEIFKTANIIEEK